MGPNEGGAGVCRTPSLSVSHGDGPRVCAVRRGRGAHVQQSAARSRRDGHGIAICRACMHESVLDRRVQQRSDLRNAKRGETTPARRPHKAEGCARTPCSEPGGYQLSQQLRHHTQPQTD
eukprot:6174589-Pleurochrysis_carterae.AAC.7